MKDLWLKPALLGVENTPLPCVEGEVGALLARAAEGVDAALGFSRSAGVLAACSLAATTLEPVGTPSPAPSAHDSHALATGHPWSDALSATFDGGVIQQAHDTQLKFEACTRLARIGATLPFALLPRALEAGQRSTALRAALLPVLGPRGRWLAEHNPDWKFATAAGRPSAGAAAPGTWLEGQHPERLAYFRQLRGDDARAARELLQASLGEMPARERIDFVTALEAGLHEDDMPLLEPLLKDRSREVRLAAARLLASLPGSAHAQRLLGWITPLLVQKKGLLGRSWQLEAPTSAEPDWNSAAIDPGRPQHDALGDRAWWLYQLVRQVPLHWWTAHTGMSPGELVAWAGKTDWKAALLRGWRERVGSSEPEWIEAMLTLRGREFRTHAGQLLALLPVTRREKHWPRTVGELWKQGIGGDVTASCAFGQTLSADYSASLFPSMLECFADDRLRHDYGLRGCLLDLAAIVHPDALRNARALVRPADETAAMAECAQAFERIVRIRAVLHSHPQ